MTEPTTFFSRLNGWFSTPEQETSPKVKAVDVSKLWMHSAYDELIEDMRGDLRISQKELDAFDSESIKNKIKLRTATKHDLKTLEKIEQIYSKGAWGATKTIFYQSLSYTASWFSKEESEYFNYLRNRSAAASIAHKNLNQKNQLSFE